MTWTFYKKKAFVAARTQICREPTTSTVPTTQDWFTIKVYRGEKGLIMEMMNQGSVVDTYKVISEGRVFLPPKSTRATELVLPGAA